MGVDRETSEGGAVVVPRVCGAGGEKLPLSFHVEGMLKAGMKGVVAVVGGPGWGKTVAMGEVKREFGEQVRVVDDWEEGKTVVDTGELMVLCAGERPAPGARVVLRVADWGEDELIEYCLKRHREKCDSILGRARRASGWERLGGCPELCATVLDAFAGDADASDITVALLRRARALAASDEEYAKRGQWYVEWALRRSGGVKTEEVRSPLSYWMHEAVAVAMAGERITVWVEDEDSFAVKRVLPVSVIDAVAERMRGRPEAVAALRRMVDDDWQCEATGGSVLVRLDPTWKPAAKSGEAKTFRRLDEGSFRGVSWAGVDLTGAAMRGADFTEADLRRAMLDWCRLEKTRLGRAWLMEASMKGVYGKEVVLAGADLTDANLEGAHLEDAVLEGVRGVRTNFYGAGLNGARLGGGVFLGAVFREARLLRSQIKDADISGADFAWAVLVGVDLREALMVRTRFDRAVLRRCNLEGVKMEEGCFGGANFEGSILTGSVFRGADMREANLTQAGLAEVEWEGADLREADFTHASFHLGSSRSGKVGSVIASEGSRTGFYTDDYNDREFKNPEEIRKANLCGCDLRGAQVLETDFYLVDLRGAIYDEEQGEHFARCGAILK